MEVTTQIRGTARGQTAGAPRARSVGSALAAITSVTRLTERIRFRAICVIHAPWGQFTRSAPGRREVGHGMAPRRQSERVAVTVRRIESVERNDPARGTPLPTLSVVVIVNILCAHPFGEA